MLLLRMIEERFHRDVEDRPIREGRTPAEHLRAGDIDYKTCPYSGSRTGKPMNVSALRQTSAHWDELLDTLGFLRAGYATALGRYAGDPLDIWRVSQLGSALPWFYLLRGQPVPAHVAALAKATLGMGIWANTTLVRMISDGWTPGELTSPTLLELAERSGTLVGLTEVCSAPDKMLLRFFDGFAASASGTGGALAAERDAVLRFGAHYQSFKLVLWIYYLARRFLYADIAAALGTMPPELAALRAAPCEPPDCIIVEPADPAALPLAQRAQWFAMLASFVVPFAPDHADVTLRNAAQLIAAMMSETGEPAFAELASEVGPALARPLATYLRLDTLFGAVLMHVEMQFRAILGVGEGPIAFAASRRDRVVASSPRAYLMTLAASLGARSTP